MKVRLTVCAGASALAVLMAFTPGMSLAQEEPEPTPVPVQAFDYGFNGFPEEWAAGEYAFTFENTSDKVPHEFVLLKNKTANKTGKEIIRISYRNEKRANKMVKFLGFNFAQPGKMGKEKFNFTANLKEGGRYFYACFVQNSKKAKPHWKKGMYGEFEIPAAEG